MKSSQTFLVVGRTFAYTRYLFVSNRITFRDAHSLGLRTGLYMFSRINILLLAGTVSVQQIGNQTMLLIWFNMLWTTNWLWIFKSRNNVCGSLYNFITSALWAAYYFIVQWLHYYNILLRENDYLDGLKKSINLQTVNKNKHFQSDVLCKVILTLFWSIWNQLT